MSTYVPEEEEKRKYEKVAVYWQAHVLRVGELKCSPCSQKSCFCQESQQPQQHLRWKYELWTWRVCSLLTLVNTQRNIHKVLAHIRRVITAIALLKTAEDAQLKGSRGRMASRSGRRSSGKQRISPGEMCLRSPQIINYPRREGERSNKEMRHVVTAGLVGQAAMWRQKRCAVKVTRADKDRQTPRGGQIRT